MRAPAPATKPAEKTSADGTAKAVPVLAAAVSLAYAGIAAVTLFHQLEGEHESAEPPFVLHVLRDGTLALPLVLMVVVGVVAVLGRPARTRGLPLPALAVVLAVVSAHALAFAAPVHELLFEAGGEEHEHSTLLHFLINTGYALAGTLPAALAVLLLPRVSRRRTDLTAQEVTTR